MTIVPLSSEWWEFWTVPEPNTGCVLWCGGSAGRYPVGWVNGRALRMHRTAYEQIFGPFDPSLKMCHRCDTPMCVNPDHLFLGTQMDNVRDMIAKGRQKKRGKNRWRTNPRQWSRSAWRDTNAR